MKCIISSCPEGFKKDIKSNKCIKIECDIGCDECTEEKCIRCSNDYEPTVNNQCKPKCNIDDCDSCS